MGKTKNVKMLMLPPKPGVCQECGVDHGPEEPHDGESLYYKYHFYSKHGRWPTWKDAMAHCSEEVQAWWTDALRKLGAEVGA